MIKTSIKLIFAAALVFAGFTAMNAQVDPQSKITTNVPFTFVVDGKTYPAGTYSFARLDTNGGDSSQLVMYGPKETAVILDTIPTVAANEAKDTHLVFEKVAGQYFLTQIWGRGDAEGAKLIESSSEKKAIAAAAGTSSTDSTSSAETNQ